MTQKELEEQHEQFLRKLYELGRDSYLGEVYVHRLGQALGMGTVQYLEERDKLARLARELAEAGYLVRSGGRFVFFTESGLEIEQTESRKEGYGYFSLTDEGRRKVEEDLL